MRVKLPSRDEIVDIQDMWMVIQNMQEYMEQHMLEMKEHELQFCEEEYSMAMVGILFRLHKMKPFWMPTWMWANHMEKRLGF